MSVDLLLVLLLSTVAVNTKPLTENSEEKGPNEIDHGTHSDSKNPPEVENPVEDAVDQTAIKPKELSEELSKTLGDAEGTKPPGTSWFLTPLIQKVQFSPQTFFQDRLVQLREFLNNLSPKNQSEDGSKQLGTSGLLNLIGLNDPGFYTNRLDPVGFFGGNGWFANKGGILGAPGALFSTGSVFTDYPTPYRK